MPVGGSSDSMKTSADRTWSVVIVFGKQILESMDLQDRALEKQQVSSSEGVKWSCVMTAPARLAVMCLQTSLRDLVHCTGVRARPNAVPESLGSGGDSLGSQTGAWPLTGNTPYDVRSLIPLSPI